MHLGIGWLQREIAASLRAYRMCMIPEISHAIKTDPRTRTDLTPTFQPATEPNSPPLQAQEQVGDKHGLQRDVPDHNEKDEKSEGEQGEQGRVGSHTAAD
ncbi:hypothetical protein FOCG_18074 [Fusarium oxysporum f. sp. radicis-lycopersici 26381]|nr:hypothetical protein FOWG_17216 [Fusarium oxysporum f. sp. lycopersici MN25]EXL39323.1 hypothetical protein FOCG_18074 [Fusarium oxysporum f. sp. radicis-lycopersici 26381]